MNMNYLWLIAFSLGAIVSIIYYIRERFDVFWSLYLYEITSCILLATTIIIGGILVCITEASITKDNIVTVTDSKVTPITEVDGRIYEVTDSKYSAHYVVFIKNEDGSISGKELSFDKTKIMIDAEEGEECYEVITEKHANKIGLYKTKTIYVIHVAH